MSSLLCSGMEWHMRKVEEDDSRMESVCRNNTNTYTGKATYMIKQRRGHLVRVDTDDEFWWSNEVLYIETCGVQNSRRVKI